MSKFFKKFNSHNDYLKYNLTIENTPNVTLCKDGIHYNSKIKLPYDKKILYLESTGLEYINTDYSVWNYGLKCEITIQRIGEQTDERAYIGRVAAGGFDLFNINSNYDLGLWVQGSNRSYEIYSGTMDNNVHTIIFEITENRLYLNNNGNEEYLAFPSKDEAKSPIQLFSHRANYNVTGRIYSCKIWDNDVMIYDLIPVRKDGIGYMYDKLSNKMFGNSGYGNLILGPDIN